MLPKYTAELSNEELYHISTLLDANKSASDIFLDYNLKVPALPKFEINWCHALEPDETKVLICPKTLRPYYNINNSTWEEEAKKAFKVNNTNKLFKGMKLV